MDISKIKIAPAEYTGTEGFPGNVPILNRAVRIKELQLSQHPCL
jgi:hypothetical protein